jgi:hypothetical protein
MISNFFYIDGSISPKLLANMLKNLLIPMLLAFLILPSFAHAGWSTPVGTVQWFNISINNTGANTMPAGTTISYAFNTATPDAYAQNVFTDWEIFNGTTGKVLVNWSGSRNINDSDLFSSGHAKILKIWFELPTNITPGNAENVLSVAYLTTVSDMTYENSSTGNLTNNSIQCFNPQNNTCFYLDNNNENTNSSCISDPEAMFCIPLEIYNNGTGIAANTQIALWFNPSNATWSNYLSSDLGNMCIYDSITANCIYSWLEGYINDHYDRGNFTTLSRPLLYWVKFGNVLPSGLTSNVLYIKIFNKSTDLYSKNGTLGANPTLYCDYGCPSKYYGENDNGKYVFDLYDNFLGNSSAFSNSSYIDPVVSAQNANWSISNGLIFTQYSAKNETQKSSIIYLSSSNYSSVDSDQNIALDVNVNPFYGRSLFLPPYGPYIYVSNSSMLGLFNPNSINANGFDIGGIADKYGNGFYLSQQVYLYSNNGTAVVGTPLDNPPPLPITIALEGQRLYIQSGYNDTMQIIRQAIQSSSNGDTFAIGSNMSYCNVYTDSACNTANKIQWLRIRNPPPNNMQPTIKFGQIIGKNPEAADNSSANSTEILWCRYCYSNYYISTGSLESTGKNYTAIQINSTQNVSQPLSGPDQMENKSNAANNSAGANVVNAPKSNYTQINNDSGLSKSPPNETSRTSASTNSTDNSTQQNLTVSSNSYNDIEAQQSGGLDIVQSGGSTPTPTQTPNLAKTTIAQGTSTIVANQSKMQNTTIQNVSKKLTILGLPVLAKSSTIASTTVPSTTITPQKGIAGNPTLSMPIFWLTAAVIAIISAMAIIVCLSLVRDRNSKDQTGLDKIGI